MGTFWQFWGFPVKTMCWTGLPEDASQQRKRYTTLRGSSQRPSRGYISHSLRVQGPNTPSGGPLRWPTTGGVPFSLLACILWETSQAHRFHRKSPKLPKSAQNRGTPLFDQFFRKVTPIHPSYSPIFEKSAGFPPAGPSAGGKTALFSKIRRIRGVDWCKLPKTVFLEGGL